MDVILRLFMVYFFVVALTQGADIPSKSISNASQFEFDGSSSGYIITAGGNDGDKTLNKNSNVYALNLDSGEWTDLPPLPYPASQFNLVLRDSTVYAVGGNNEYGKTNKTFILSIKDNMWKIGSDLVFSYGYVLSASLNGSIYAVGGTSEQTLQAMGCNGAWNRLASSIHDHIQYHDAIAVLNDKLYVLGCHHRDEMYDPSTNTWTAIKLTNQDRCYAAGIVALNGYIYVIGGCNAKNERYDPATGDLTYFEACLYTPYHSAVVTDGEKIYVIAGNVVGGNAGGAVSNKVQVYRPDLDLWQSMGNYPASVQELGAVYVKELPTD